MFDHKKNNRERLDQIEDLVKQDSINALKESHLNSLLFILENEKREYLRIRAFRLLAATHNERFLMPLINEFVKNSPWYQEIKAEHLIGSNPAIVKPLIEAFNMMPINARLQAIRVIGYFKDEGSISFLRALVILNNSVPPTIDNREGSRMIVRKAINALGKIPHKDSVEVLVESVKYRNFHQISLNGLRYIGKIDPALLLPHLKTDNLLVKRKIVRLLGDFRNPIAVDSLVSVLRSDDVSVIFNTITAFGKIGDKRSVHFLDELLEHKNPRIRESAVRALGFIGNQESFTSVIKLNQDIDASVRAQVVWTLGKIGNPDAIPYLKALSVDDHSNVRRHAAVALSNFDIPESFDSLRNLLDDQDKKVVQAAVESLGKIHQPETVGTLIPFLRDERYLVRQAAVRSIGELGDKKVYGSLMDILFDSDPYLQAEIMIALGRIKDNRAVSYLMDSLDSHDPYIRMAAKWSYNNIVSKRNVESKILFKFFQSGLFDGVRKSVANRRIHPVMKDIVLDVLYYRRVDNCDLSSETITRSFCNRIDSLKPSDKRRLLRNLRHVSEASNIYNIDSNLWKQLNKKYPDKVSQFFSNLSVCGCLLLLLLGFGWLLRAIWLFLVTIWDWLAGNF